MSFAFIYACAFLIFYRIFCFIVIYIFFLLYLLIFNAAITVLPFFLNEHCIYLCMCIFNLLQCILFCCCCCCCCFFKLFTDFQCCSNCTSFSFYDLGIYLCMCISNLFQCILFCYFFFQTIH